MSEIETPVPAHLDGGRVRRVADRPPPAGETRVRRLVAVRLYASHGSRLESPSCLHAGRRAPGAHANL